MATAKKGTGRKSAAKKTGVKKPAATVKKAQDGKGTAAKSSVKKTPVRKSAPAKSSAKKTPVRKSAARSKPVAPVTRQETVLLTEIPKNDAAVIQGGRIVRSRDERRRQILALLVSLFLLLLTIILVDRHEGIDKVMTLRSGALAAEKAKNYRKAIDKLDAALNVLDRIQGKISTDRKKDHRKLDSIRKTLQDDLKRNLLKEAARLQKQARKLEEDGHEDRALDALKKALAITTRLKEDPWKKDRNLQRRVNRLNDDLEKRRKNLELKDPEVDRLMKRAREDEDDGLFRDALKKLDLARDRLDVLKRGLKDRDPDIRTAWRNRIRDLEMQIRRARRRIKAKIDAKERQERERLRRRDRTNDGNNSRGNNTRDPRSDRTDPRRNTNGTRTTGKRTGTTGTTGTGTGIKPKDIRNRVRDVNVKGKDRVDYNRSAGIEKD